MAPKSKLSPPSYTEPIPLPTFALSWRNSVITYSGGGGSAKTGVQNKIILKTNDQTFEIDTKESLCAAITINPQGTVLAAGVDKVLKLYSTSDASEVEGEFKTNSFINAIAFSNNGQYICLGCEDGTVDFWNVNTKSRISTSEDGSHSNKAVCAVCWSPDDKHVVSSGKDGTARVWNTTGKAIHVLQCKIGDNLAEEKKFEKKPILVRGCKYLHDGTIITIASSKRGKAFLSLWDVNRKELKRVCCSQVPISAMDISHDHSFLALGGVDGSITIINATTYTVMKKFEEIHDLPVTCIAARPQQANPDHEYVSVISASADNKMAYLSLKKFRNSTYMMDFMMLVLVVIIAMIVQFCYKECSDVVSIEHSSVTCVKNVLIADTNQQPWILDPPH